MKRTYFFTVLSISILFSALALNPIEAADNQTKAKYLIDNLICQNETKDKNLVGQPQQGGGSGAPAGSGDTKKKILGNPNQNGENK
ncbi:MAG: hypothetical protein N2517_05360 [Ignavibacteria bacterium]|nr:hypothetical protein [Ignavibacteria bacterium]